MEDSTTAAGVLGLQRPSMNDNTLLLRAPLGRSRTWCHHVPKDATFGGFPSNEFEFGTKQLLNWSSSANTVRPMHQDYSVSDYMALNKVALSAGLTSAREVSEFRRTHDIRRSPLKRQTKPTGRSPTLDTVDLRARPSSPICDLLSHTYGRRWVEERMQFSQAASSVLDEKNSVKRAPYQTRSSLLKMHQNVAEEKPLWKLPQFERAKSSIDTNRRRADRATCASEN